MACRSILSIMAMHLLGYISTQTARLFERIPIQYQVHNRKSFVSRANTTAIWQRIPQPARDSELEIHPEFLQTKLSNNFIPPPAKKVARKTRNSTRSDLRSPTLVIKALMNLRYRPQRAAKTSGPRNRPWRGIAVKQPGQAPIDITDSSDTNTHNDLYASDSGHSTRRQAQTEGVEGPSDEIMLTLQNLSGLTIQPSKGGAPGSSRRPPFLRSHLRKSFLKRCETEGIPTKGGKMREPEITYVYRTLGSDNTFRATVKHWGCPLCDTYSKLETQQVLERHLGDKDGGHPEVKVEMRKEKVGLSYTSVAQHLNTFQDYVWTITLVMPEVAEEEEEVDSCVITKAEPGFLSHRLIADPNQKLWRFSLTPPHVVNGKLLLRTVERERFPWM